MTQSAPSSEEIRDHQKATWNRFSPGWRKWDEFTMAFLRPMGDAIIASLQLKDGMMVLDIATGTGEPGLTIAATLPTARVIGSDLSDGMLEIARERAVQRGLKNYEAVAADVCSLDFPDATFDAISCRMGFMFFPDMALAAKEMARVLKPRGRVATSVWMGGDVNPWVAIVMGIISRRLHLPAPAPEAPGMFRCAAPGLISGFFQAAGLTDPAESEITGQVTYAGGASQYWTMMTEVAAPVVNALAKADPATIEAVRSDVFAAVGSAPTVSLDFASRIISARKP